MTRTGIIIGSKYKFWINMIAHDYTQARSNQFMTHDKFNELGIFPRIFLYNLQILKIY